MAADQLAAFLKETYGDAFVVGEKDCNLLYMQGTEGTLAAFLLIGVDYGGQKRPGVPFVRHALQGAYRNRPAFAALHRLANQISGIPVRTICYPAWYPAPGKDWGSISYDGVAFYLQDLTRSRVVEELSTTQLRGVIHHLIGVTDTLRGTNKDENKRLADFFHYWSRRELSPQLRKVDVDGFLEMPGGKVLIEIKRSNKPGIARWRPYPRDYQDFVVQAEVASRLDARYWILHHETCPSAPGIDPHAHISLFDVDKVGDGELHYARQLINVPLQGASSKSLTSIIGNLQKAK